MIQEKAKKELISEEEDKRAIELERKILNILLPALGIICFILGVFGTILTATGEPLSVGTLVFYIVMTVFGVIGILYMVLVILRKKNPYFLKKKPVEEESPLSD